MREELSRYQSAAPCEVCHGARLKPEPLAVKIAGEDISHVVAPQRRRRARLVRRRSHDKLTATAERDRQRHPQGNQRAPRLPPQCRARLSPPRPHQRHAVGRREPAHPPRQSRSAPACRASSTSSTSPRSASTRRTTTACSKRSSACAASATPCWWSSMTRTRSATPTMSSTWAPAPASTAAKWSAPGTLDDLLACKDSLTADYLTGRREIPLLATRRKGIGQERHRPRRHRQQPRTTSPSPSRSAPSPASPGSAAAASRRSPSTRSTPAPRAR